MAAASIPFTALGRAALLVALCLVAFPRNATGGEDGGLAVELVPAGDDLLTGEMDGRAASVTPPDGGGLAIGAVSADGFAVGDLSHIAVETADGASLPVMVERAGAFLEFDAYVVARIAFAVPADALETGAVFRIRWGEGVGPAEVVDRFVADAPPERVFTFRPASAGGDDGAAGASTTELVVIADEEAAYYSLWYLLPMALIFALLTIRKIQASDRNAAADS